MKRDIQPSAPAARRVAALVLIAGLAVTAALLLWSWRESQARVQLDIDTRADALKLAIEHRFQSAGHALDALAAVVAVQGGAGQADLQRLGALASARGGARGLLSLAIVDVVERAGLARYEAGVSPVGGRSFSVHPRDGAAQRLYVVRGVAPVEAALPAWGRDIGADPGLRADIERAIATGQAALSGHFEPADGAARRPVMLMLAAFYRPGAALDTEAQRRSALVTLGCVAIAVPELLQGLQAQVDDSARVRLYDGRATAVEPLFGLNLVAASDSLAGHFEARGQRTLEIAGRPLTLLVEATPALAERLGAVRRLALLGSVGVLLSLLLAGACVWRRTVGSKERTGPERLDASQAQLRRVLAGASDAVLCLDPEGRIAWVNDAATRLLQSTAAALIGVRSDELPAQGGAQEAGMRLLREALVHAQPVTVDQQILQAGTKTAWVRRQLLPLRDEAGVLTGFLDTMQDISEHKDTQASLADALAESQALWRAVYAHAIVSVTDLQGNLIDANDAFVEISGFAKQELLGCNHRIVNSGLHEPAYWQQMWDSISAGRPWRGEIRNRRKDGSHYWVDSLIAPLLGADGLPHRYVSIRFDITASRHMAAQAELERRNLANLIEATSAGTWEVDVDTGATRINDQLAHMLGRQPADFQTFSMKALMQMLHPSDAPMVGENIRACLTGQRPLYEVEFRMPHQDGRWVWVLARGKVIEHHPDGRPRLFAGTHLDVTTRKQAEETMRSERLLLARVERLAGVGGWQMDLAGQTTHWSDEAARLFQFERGAHPPAESVFARILPPGRDALSAAMQQAIRQAQGWDFELEVEQSGGQTIWLRSVGEAEFDDGGAVRLVGAFADITLRRALEAETRRQHVLMESVLQNMPGGVSVFDERLGLVVVNDQFRQLLTLPDHLACAGKTRFEDIIRFNAHRGDYGPLEDPEAFVAVVVKKAKQPVAHRMERTRPNGVTLDIRGTPMPGGGFVTVYSDISELKKAQHDAEAAAKAKGQFLASMSHEIRTPMNAVLGMLTLLQRTQLNESQRDYAAKAARAARSLLDLLNDILDFSKAEAGRMELDPRPFSPDRLLQDLGVILAANVGAKPVELLFEVDPELPIELIGDSMRLQQVLINLAGNAVKFTDRGEVTVAVRCVERDAGDGQVGVEFGVRDTGVGIAPENHARIFSGFTQAESSTARRYGGTGLGLAISQRLVELMGGHIDIDSAPGRGSCFSFRVRLQVQSPAIGQQLQGQHVLIVDDHPGARSALAGMFTAQGATAEMAADGAAALALVKHALAEDRAFSAVVVDAQMPGMDGWETTQAVHAAFESANVVVWPRVLILTAPGQALLSQGGDAHVRRSGVTAVLAKPVTPGMLVGALLGSRDAEASAAVQCRLQGLRLLLAEDNPNNQQIARELLEDEGAEVVLADDGEAALAALTAPGARFDAVLMDVQMPRMDGLEATRRLRAMASLQALPVLAMTANISAQDRAACRAAGMNEHVGKPFDMDQLVAALHRQLPGHGATHHDAALDLAAHAQRLAAAQVDDEREAAAAAQGLALRAAYERMMGKAELLLRMSQSFAASAQTLVARLRGFQVLADVDTALQTVHGCKGLAATVGAVRIASLAEQCENQLKNGSWPDEAWLQFMDETVQKDSQALVSHAQALAASVNSVSL